MNTIDSIIYYTFHQIIREAKDLPRTIKFLKQRIMRGWADSETWSLDYSLAKLILPRLKRFKEVTIAVPNDLTNEEWHKILDKMIFAMEFLASEERWDCYDEKILKKVHKGTKLFGDYYMSLWW